MKFHFTWRFTSDLEADDQAEVCRAVAKIFEKESKEWRRRDGGIWRNQLHRPDLDILKNVQVKV